MGLGKRTTEYSVFCKFKIKGPNNTCFFISLMLLHFLISQLTVAAVLFCITLPAAPLRRRILCFWPLLKKPAAARLHQNHFFYSLIILFRITILSLDNIGPLVCCWASRLPRALEKHLNKGRSCAWVYLFLPLYQTLEDLQNTQTALRACKAQGISAS